MTYYEMLAGRTPFDKLSAEFAILKAIDAHDFPPLNQLNPSLPEPLVEIITKALEREPDDRYQSAGAMLKALDAWQAGPAAGEVAQPTTTAKPPDASKEEQNKGLKSLKGTLTKGRGARKKTSQADIKTVLTDAPLKKPARQAAKPVTPPPSPAPAPKPSASAETPKSAPDTPSTPPAPKPPPREKRPLQKRPLFMIGAAGVLLLIVFLIYLGTSGETTSPPDRGLSAAGADSTAQTASLSIRTLPAEAVVFVDSQRVGSTPLIDLQVDVGARALRIEKAGFITLDTAIVVDTSQTPAFTFALREEEDTPEDVQEPEVMVLAVTSEPAGAEVLLDGQSVGQTPLRLEDPEPGAHDLVLRKRGYQDYAGSITVQPGGQTTVNETLAALTGTIEITVRPFGDIYVDEMLKAQRSAESYTQDVTTGAYKVRVVHPEYGVWERQISIDTSGAHAFLFNFDQEFEVSVTSEPDRADILVDGQPVGKRTPGTVRVRPGRRTIAVRRRGYIMEGAARVLTLERNWTDDPLHFTMRAVQ